MVPKAEWREVTCRGLRGVEVQDLPSPVETPAGLGPISRVALVLHDHSRPHVSMVSFLAKDIPSLCKCQELYETQEMAERSSEKLGAPKGPNTKLLRFPAIGFLWITTLICTVCVAPTQAFYIHPQNELESPHLVLSPLQRRISPAAIFPIYGQLTRSSAKGPTGNLTNKVAVVTLQSPEDDLKILKLYADSGVAAIVMVLDQPERFPGFYQYTRKRIKEPVEFAFPVFEITKTQDNDLKGWFANQTGPNGVFVSFDQQETNPWRWVFKYYVPILANLLLAMSAITLVMAAYKMIILVQTNGFQVSMAQMVILLNIECLIFRTIWLALDPFGAYGASPALWVSIGQTLPFAFAMCGLLLITSYWHEMIHRTGAKVNMFLSKLRIPFWIAAFLIIGGELASGVVRGLGYHVSILLLIDGIIYAVVILLLLIFFIHTKKRLNRVFKELNKNLKESKQKKLALASNIVITMTSVMVAWFIALLMMAIGDFVWTPGGFVPVWTILLVGMNVMCLMQVLLIRAPYRPWKWIICGLFVDDPSALLSDGSSSDHTTKTPNSEV